jgi:tetratricopeptide (TPR) repeat protein
MRLIGYFALVFLVLYLLRHVPGIGGIFRVPFLGFIVASALVSLVISWSTVRAMDGRRARVLERELRGTVETPHNQGKLGSLLLAQGRASKAIVHLERAVAGEPDSAEWRYRLGSAYVRARRAGDAVPVLERAAAIDEEHAYGMVLLRLAQAQRSAGDAQASLATLERFERNHGPNPESAYRRGLALKSLGRREEARAALAEVSRLAAHAARFQKGRQRGFVVRALLARVT